MDNNIARNLESELKDARQEISRLQAIVDQIEHTAYGVPLIGDWTAWWRATWYSYLGERGQIVGFNSRDYYNTHEDERPSLSNCFSSRDALLKYERES